MASRARYVLGWLVLVGCGGSVFSGGDGNGTGGSGAQAGSMTSGSNPGGSSSGASSSGGSSAGGSSSGGNGTAGTRPVGGTAGGTSSGGSALGGTSTGGSGGTCETVRCAPVECRQGQLITPPGECCPRCSCENIDCAYPLCESGVEPVIEPGNCCPTCPPPDDRLYCEQDGDCMVADRPRSCCECPEAISVRMCEQDPCWFQPDAPRMIPRSCYPYFVCDALCEQCLPPKAAKCDNHRCTLVQ